MFIESHDNQLNINDYDREENSQPTVENQNQNKIINKKKKKD